jgi:hypothetical protein
MPKKSFALIAERKKCSVKYPYFPWVLIPSQRYPEQNQAVIVALQETVIVVDEI